MSKLKIRTLNLIITEDCTYNCSYCPQHKNKTYMNSSTIEKSIDFFFPFLPQKPTIRFLGGEPLLAFDNIRHTVSYCDSKNKKSKNNKKTWQFNLTTNGQLLTDEILTFFNLYKFSLSLSFDGLAQNIGRKKGTFDFTYNLIEHIQKYPDITLSIYSTFSPLTISYLSNSIKLIIESGAPDITFFISITQPWEKHELDILSNELKLVTDFLASYYKSFKKIPVTNFREIKKIPGIKFACSGGKTQMAVAPDESVWGCGVFHDYLEDKQNTEDFNSYFFGHLDDFIKNYKETYPRILTNYSSLRHDCFFSGKNPCYLCDEVENCTTCPVNTAYVTSFIGKIPSYTCEVNKIYNSEIKRFNLPFL
jgi:uncharacterized protein